MLNRFLAAVSAATILAPTLALALPAEGQEGWMAGHHMSYGFFGMWHGPVVFILALIAIVMIVMLALRLCEMRCRRHYHHSNAACADEKSALNTLKTRFACGEIDQDEYRSRKKALEE